MRNVLLSYRRPLALRTGWLRLLFTRETAGSAWPLLITVLVVGAVCFLGDVTVFIAGDRYPFMKNLADPVGFLDALTFVLGRRWSRSSAPSAVAARRWLWAPFLIFRLINGWAMYLAYLPGSYGLLVFPVPVAICWAIVFAGVPLVGWRVIRRLARGITAAVGLPIVLFGLRLTS